MDYPIRHSNFPLSVSVCLSLFLFSVSVSVSPLSLQLQKETGSFTLFPSNYKFLDGKWFSEEEVPWYALPGTFLTIGAEIKAQYVVDLVQILGECNPNAPKKDWEQVYNLLGI